MADPSESSQPFSTSSTASEEDWARLMRALGARDGVVSSTGLPTATDLKVTANGTSSVTINAGEALVGGFKYRNTSTITRAVPTNAGGSTARVDHVVLEASQTANEVTVKYVTGGSTVPALTQNISGVWQMRLAQVTVRAGAAGALTADCLDRREFIGPQTTMSSNEYLPPSRPGQLLYRPDSVRVGTETGWETLFPEPGPQWYGPELAGGYANRGGDYFNLAYTKARDGRVTLRGWFRATATKGAGSILFILPSGYRPSQQQSFVTPGSTGGGVGRIDVALDGRVLVALAQGTNDNGSVDGISFLAA